jgi:hypothetical protein
MKVGYHESLWEKDLWIEADIENRKNIEENYKASLLGIYGEYIDILKNLYPDMKSLPIDNEEVRIKRLLMESLVLHADAHFFSLSLSLSLSYLSFSSLPPHLMRYTFFHSINSSHFF